MAIETVDDLDALQGLQDLYSGSEVGCCGLVCVPDENVHWLPSWLLMVRYTSSKAGCCWNR